MIATFRVTRQVFEKAGFSSYGRRAVFLVIVCSQGPMTTLPEMSDCFRVWDGGQRDDH